MPGAVHRLDRVGVLVVDRDQEHVLAELLPVARGHPERLVVDQRRLHLGVAAPRVLAPAQILERVEDRHPLRMPERRSRRVLVEVEQVELRAEPAVVARAGLLEPLEVRVEILLAEERRPVDARQLRVLLVAAPVGAGERGELEGLDRRGGLQVRAAAEVGEVALGVERDRALGGVDELDLVLLALGREPRPRLVGRDLLALPGAPLGELALHLGLDRLEVGVVDRRREVEVVVEAVLDRRPDRDLDARMEPAHRLGEQVGGRVAEDGERVGILRVARRQDLERRAVGERQPQVLRHPVRLHEHGLLGELRADRARGVEAGGAVGQLELGRVGEDHLHRRRRIVGRERPEPSGEGLRTGARRITRPSDTREPARLPTTHACRCPSTRVPLAPPRPSDFSGARDSARAPARSARSPREGLDGAVARLLTDRPRQPRRQAAEGQRPPPLPARQVRPRPPLVARPHGAHEPAADRADDARLARLVRDLERDRRLAAADDPAEQHVPPLGARLVPRPRHAGDREPGDAALPERAREREGRARTRTTRAS